MAASGGQDLSSKGGLLDEPTGCVEHALFQYGLSYGRRPGLFALPGLAIVIFCVVGALQVKQSEVAFERQWSTSGGRLERELDYRDKYHQKQWKSINNQMVIVQNNGEDGIGGNVVTSEAFEELTALYKVFYSVNVTTKSNKTFDTYDLCARGNNLDVPANLTICTLLNGLEALCAANPMHVQCMEPGFTMTKLQMQMGCNRGFYFPCQVVGPLDCFREAAVTHDPVYRTLYDPYIAYIPPLRNIGAFSYSQRPSFRNKSAQELMQILVNTSRPPSMAKGCNWWTRGAVFSPQLFLGGEHGHRAEAFLVSFVMEAPERIKFRSAVTKPNLVASKADIEEALTLFGEKWEQETNAKSATFKHLLPVAMSAGAVERSTEQLQQFPARGFLFTILGMFVLFGLLFGFRSCSKPFESRLCVSLSGLFLVIVSLVASVGLCGWVGLDLNPTMLQVLPFLAVGLGVDDVLVMLFYFDGIGVTALMSASREQVMATVMAQAGTSVILSSLCNTATFACCFFLRIPGVVDFGKGGAILMAINLIVVLTLFPSTLVLESVRIRKKQADPLCFCCHQRQKNKASAVVETKARMEGVTQRFASCISRLPVKVSVVALSIVTFAGCLWLALNMDSGYQVDELISTDSPLHYGYKRLFRYFGTFPSRLCVMDVNYPAKQQQILELHDRLLKTPFVERAPSTMWLTSFYRAVPNQLMDNASYAHPTLASRGIMNANASTFYSYLRTWSELPATPLEALKGGTFIAADMTGINQFGRRDMNQPLSADNPFMFTFSNFWLAGVIKPGDFVSSIKGIRQLIADSPLKDHAFPEGQIFVYWEVFQSLFNMYWIALGSSLVSVFLITVLLLQSIRASIVATMMSAMITIEIFGINALYLQFNVFVCASLLLASGVSVEFTVHIITAFEHQVGTVSERLAKAMATTLPPVLLGSTTTLLCVVPIAFAKVPFLRLYMFSTTVIVIVVGVFNATVVLPACLAIFVSDVKKHVTPKEDVVPQVQPPLEAEADDTSRSTPAEAIEEVNKPIPVAPSPPVETDQDTDCIQISTKAQFDGMNQGQPPDYTPNFKLQL